MRSFLEAGVGVQKLDQTVDRTCRSSENTLAMHDNVTKHARFVNALKHNSQYLLAGYQQLISSSSSSSSSSSPSFPSLSSHQQRPSRQTYAIHECKFMLHSLTSALKELHKIKRRKLKA
uniref:Uncharacterized protein n=1 Tax=Glossina pallidipes TaxID=7398 RepID=A0A1A9ZL26_GLOPL